MSINAQLTAGAIITQAMRLIGVLDATQPPTAAMTAQGLLSLQWMLKGWQADGCNLFRREQMSEDVTIGTQSFVLDPRVIDVSEGRWLQPQSSSQYERPLACYQYNEYWTLPNKQATSQSGPTCFMFDKRSSEVKIWLWPIPSLASTMLYTAARVIDDVTETSDILDLPQEWTECAYYGLAARLLDIYGIPQADPPTAQRIQAGADLSYAKMLNFDRPTSVTFRPWGTQRRYGRR